MIKVFPRTIAVATVALLLAVSVTTTSLRASDARCFNDWATASAIVSTKRLVDSAALNELVRKKYGGKIMTSRLCNGHDGYFYSLVIRHHDGRVQRVKIRASEMKGDLRR